MRSACHPVAGAALILLTCLCLVLAGMGCGSKSDPGTSPQKPQAGQKPALQGKNPGIVEILPFGPEKKKPGGTIGTTESKLPPAVEGEIVLPPEGSMSTAEKMAYSAMKAKMQVQPPEERPYNPGKPTAAEEAAKGFEMGRYQQGSKGMTTSPGKKPGQESQAEEKARGMAPGKF